MTYSMDFRRKVLSVREREELTIAEVAERFGVGVATVVRWLKNIEIKVHGPRRRKIDLDVLKMDIETYPDAYQHERAARLGVAKNAVFRALRKLGVTYKKNTAAPQGERRRTATVSGGHRKV